MIIKNTRRGIEKKPAGGAVNGFETNVPFLLNSSLQSGFVNHL